ncbi:MAG: hypothetical protein ABR498_06090 [Candidatus Dormibacteria bacterium]
MPAFNFGGRELPPTVRSARALLYLEAGILMLAGAFAVIIGVVLGAGNAIPYAGVMITGSGAALLGVLYIALGLAATGFAVQLGRLAGWSRNAIIVLQAVLIVLFMARGDFSFSLFLSVLLCIAVAVLLVTSSASAALSKPSRAAKREVSSAQSKG